MELWTCSQALNEISGQRQTLSFLEEVEFEPVVQMGLWSLLQVRRKGKKKLYVSLGAMRLVTDKVPEVGLNN